ncbi:cytochrome c biogenesis protein CcsA [Ferruginibacter sp. SUN106]|uniref:cytochrome c biogenesis protein CcsA n=1 Tax=Ferruginibacter sp. SUN106 TaxID=2978348 RepID=UPI003D35B853
MQFEGEHLFPGQIGHFFVVLAFVASIIATIAYFKASILKDITEKQSWIRFARIAFITQIVSAFVIFSVIFYICSHHYFEYMYAYKHASKELESKYLLACIWEGQEGSFLLWTIWHSIIGLFIIIKSKKPLLQGWEAPVMTVISFAQFFLGMMILGIYFFGIRIGSSPFTLTRNEIDGPVFGMPNYLTFIKDGVGLNVLLRNYWMVIHPPVLFLGFASTIIPFAFAYAGIQTKRFGDWVKPALPFALFCACVLGVGIMMGGKWAYESLSFGGYWAWDPVENASLVPWLILIAGLHTMVIYKATGQSLRASYLFAILSFAFILYSTFLTRTGVLGDTSVHAFTDAGAAINIMLIVFMAAFTVPGLVLFFKNYNKIPSIEKEERTDSREFWMFIGSIIFFLSAIFISAKTSVPVFNKIFGTKIAPPEDVEFSYNKVMVLVAFIIGILTAISQYFKYKNTPSAYILKKIAVPTLLAAVVTAALAIFYPITYYKQGAGFLGAIYIALFAAIYAIFANAIYIWTGLNGKLKAAGASVAHLGFAIMLLGMLIASGNKKTISDNTVTGINIPFGKESKENPLENLTMLRDVPTRMLDYSVTYSGDSLGSETGRIFHKLKFVKKDSSEQFELTPDVYVGKNELKSSNPGTKRYLTKDIYTYISSINPDGNRNDTAKFKIKELAVGDTAYYNKGYMILNKVVSNPDNERFHFKTTDAAIMADITLVNKDGMHYKGYPAIQININGQDSSAINIDDTVYAQNLYLQFAGITNDRKIKLGIKESDKIIDFITLKAYLFPYINLVWLGLVIMAIGLVMSMIKRAKLTPLYAVAILAFVIVALSYMFFVAGG